MLRLLAEVAELRGTIAAQRDEIARLKGGPPQPNIKPSGMEQASDSPESSPKRPRGSTQSKLSLRLLPAGAVAGWGLHPLESAALPRRTPAADDQATPA